MNHDSQVHPFSNGPELERVSWITFHLRASAGGGGQDVVQDLLASLRSDFNMVVSSCWPGIIELVRLPESLAERNFQW
jgi:hypothetical protein